MRKSGIMVLCRACDQYLRLLSGKEDNSLISNERIMSGKLYYQFNDKRESSCYSG